MIFSKRVLSHTNAKFLPWYYNPYSPNIGLAVISNGCSLSSTVSMNFLSVAMIAKWQRPCLHAEFSGRAAIAGRLVAMPRLVLEQPRLSLESAAVPGEGSIGADDAVTGHDDGDGISTVG